MTEPANSPGAGFANRLAAGAKTAFMPGPRMVDEAECVVSVLLAILFGHLVGAQNIAWAAFSGYMVMRGHVAETFLRGALRIVGTVVGALLGLGLTPLVEASPFASAGALAIVCGLSLYGALTAKRSYAWLFVALTFAMILLDKLEHPADPLGSFVRTRILEVIAGTGACVLVSLLSTASIRRLYPAKRAPPPRRLGWVPEAARHAGQAATALAFLPFLGAIWHVPQLAQSAVTVLAVMLVPVNAIGAGALVPVSRRILLRVIGCSAGAILSAAVLFAGQDSAAALIAGTMLGVAIGRHIENGQGRFAYAGVQFTLVVLVTLVPDSYAHARLGPAVERLTGILVGILLLEPVLLAWRMVSPRSGGTAAGAAPGELGDL